MQIQRRMRQDVTALYLMQGNLLLMQGLMCGSTVRKVHGVAIRNSSEITELSGSNGIRTSMRNWNLLAGT